MADCSSYHGARAVRSLFAHTTWLALAAAASACAPADRPEPTGPAHPADLTPRAAITDARGGGDPHFFWLPPIAPATTFPGTFDAALAPELRICPFANGACTGPALVFTRTSSPAIVVDANAESYSLDWSTRSASITTGDYRAEVRVAGLRLGFADVRVVANAKDLMSVPADFVGVQRGKTLTFAFRIETGIVGQVTIAPRDSSVIVGATRQFFATVRDLHGTVIPGAPVTWTSSVPFFATIDAGGLATGISTGVTTIVATSGGVLDSTFLTVVPVPVARVEVTPGDTVSLIVGEHIAFSATAFDANDNVLFGRDITWTSRDRSVAAVSPDGLVTALGPGFTRIVASIEGKSDSGFVDVRAATIP